MKLLFTLITLLSFASIASAEINLSADNKEILKAVKEALVRANLSCKVDGKATENKSGDLRVHAVYKDAVDTTIELIQEDKPIIQIYKETNKNKYVTKLYTNETQREVLKLEHSGYTKTIKRTNVGTILNPVYKDAPSYKRFDYIICQ